MPLLGDMQQNKDVNICNQMPSKTQSGKHGDRQNGDSFPNTGPNDRCRNTTPMAATQAVGNTVPENGQEDEDFLLGCHDRLRNSIHGSKTMVQKHGLTRSGSVEWEIGQMVLGQTGNVNVPQRDG